MRIANPFWALIRRELLTTLRGTRVFLMLLFFITVAGLYAMGTWPAGIDSFVEAGEASRQLIQSLIWVLFAGTVIFVPAFASNAIVNERERSTYDFLRMSLIRPSGVVIAKLLNAVGIFLILYMALLPVFAVTFFLIGVDVLETVRAMGVLITTTFACASGGLLASSLSRRGFTAIGLSYLSVVVLMLGPLILTYLVVAVIATFEDIRSVFGSLETIAQFSSPAGAMTSALYRPLPIHLYALSLAYPLLFTAFCLFITYRQVRKPPRPPKIEQAKPIDNEVELKQRRYGYPFYLIDPLRRKKPIEDRRNPMMVREMRWGLFNRGTTLIRVFYLSFVVYFFAGALVIIDPDTTSVMYTWVMSQLILTILVAPTLMANAFTKEHELGNMDMLRMTLLRPRDLVIGKLTAGTGSVSPLILAALLSCVPILFMGIRRFDILAMGYSNLVVCTLLSLSIGLMCSMFTRKTSTSLALSYTLGFVLFIGMYLAIRWALWWLTPELYENVDSNWSIMSSPIIAFWATVNEGRFAAGPEHLDITKWATAMAVWLSVSFLMIAASIGYFATFKMRDP